MRQWEQELEVLELEVRRRPKAAEAAVRSLLSALRDALAEEPANNDLRRLEARGRMAEAVQHTQLGRLGLAEAALQQLYDDYKRTGDHKGMAQCLHPLFVVADKRNDPEEALRRLEQCFRLQSRHGASKGEQAHTLMQTGIFQAIHEKRDEARASLEFAEELMPAAFTVRLGIIRTNLALLDRSCGDRERAFERLTSAVDLLEPEGASGSLLNATLELAAEEIWRGSLSDAERRLSQSQLLMDQL